MDRLLLRAYQQFDDETSSQHGLPYWVARSLDPEIMFVVEEREDRAQAALEKAEEKAAEQEKKSGKKRHGISRFPVAMTVDGKPLVYGGLTRQQFQRAAIQVAQDLAEGLPEDFERDRPEGFDPSEYGDGELTGPE